MVKYVEKHKCSLCKNDSSFTIYEKPFGVFRAIECNKCHAFIELCYSKE